MDTTRASLLLRIRDRSDTAAWRQFDTIYRPMLMRFAKGRGLDHAGAEDVTQHCMAAVSKHIERFDYDPRKGRFKGWQPLKVQPVTRSSPASIAPGTRSSR